MDVDEAAIVRSCFSSLMDEQEYDEFACTACEPFFSEALSQNSERKEGMRARPKGTCEDVLANEGAALDGDHFGEDGEGYGGRVIVGQQMAYAPSKQEWDDHQRSHIPFRKWCPCVLKARAPQELTEESRNQMKT